MRNCWRGPDYQDFDFDPYYQYEQPFERGRGRRQNLYPYEEQFYRNEDDYFYRTRGRDKNRRAMTPKHYPDRGYRDREEPYSLYRRNRYDYARGRKEVDWAEKQMRRRANPHNFYHDFDLSDNPDLRRRHYTPTRRSNRPFYIENSTPIRGNRQTPRVTWNIHSTRSVSVQDHRRSRSQIPKRNSKRNFREVERDNPPKSKIVTDEMLKQRRKEIMKLKNPNYNQISEFEQNQLHRKRVVTPNKNKKVLIEKPTIVRYSDPDNSRTAMAPKTSVLDSRIISKLFNKLSKLTLLQEKIEKSLLSVLDQQPAQAPEAIILTILLLEKSRKKTFRYMLKVRNLASTGQ